MVEGTMQVRITKEDGRFFITPANEEDELNSDALDSFFTGQETYKESTNQHGTYFSMLLPDDIYEPIANLSSKVQIDMEDLVIEILRDWIKEGV